MGQLRALCGGLLALTPGGAAWWPFGGGGPDEGEAPASAPHFAFGGVPGVVVVENHFGGFDPWEDLHKNMQRVVHQSAHPMLSLGEGNQALAQPLEDQLGSILSVFGDHHAGHFGRSGSFEVDDDHRTRFRITAQLPGYRFGAEASGPGTESPLSVRAVGRRSLVVSGMQQMGHMITSWQRSFSLPKGCDINNISVTYSSASGNLTVDVPRLNATEAGAADAGEEEEEEEGAFGEDEGLDRMLPPALRAMQSGMPAIVGQLMGPEQLQGRRNSGFLMPAPDLPEMLEEVFGMMGQMHPRFHLPAGGDKPVPEDAIVNLVGCFAESQLDKVELKYYGEANAASFNAMYWHARSDHVPYFAMSRHEQPIGHAFTAHGFVHEGEKPDWGVYDGCGSPCSDEPNRWCGCANEGQRGLANNDCPKEGEKRFAVYKIGEAQRPEQEDNKASQGDEPGATAERPQVVAQGRPYWQLSGGERNASDAPAIEIVVPKGTVAKAQGREVILYNASDPEATLHAPEQAPAAPGADAPASKGPMAKGGGEATPLAATGVRAAAGAGGSTAEATTANPTTASIAPAAQGAAAAGSAAAAPAPQLPTAAPVGKMRLPVGVSAEACSWDTARTAQDGGQVIKCPLDQRDVKSVPIKVIDEL